MPLKELKAKLADALAAARSAPNDRELSVAVEDLQKAISASITEGAMPCPKCKVMPLGMEHPTGRGGVEFEIGCLTCKPFVHDDGTKRQCRTRGGSMAKHAVEAWNEGPDCWLKCS
jgi:hypothetical protein